MLKCEINLFKPPDNIYVAGSEVSGIVRYELSQETIFNRISVSLKGLGQLVIHQNVYRGHRFHTQRYEKEETYVDIQNVIQDDTKHMPIQAGIHEVPFSFILPDHLPPTFKYKKTVHLVHHINCKIFYYIRIKFERPGFLKFDKKFKRRINVASVVTPTILTPSVVHGVQKTPFDLFSKQDSYVNVKGSVENPITLPGGRVKINCEIVNNTKLEIKVVKIRLVAEYSFANNDFIGAEVTEDMKSTDIKTTPIGAGDSQVMAFIMDIPSDTITIQHSKVVARDYFVYIIAVLPPPRRNVVLKLPIEIKNVDIVEAAENLGNDAPPSYFEAMEECAKDDLD